MLTPVQDLLVVELRRYLFVAIDRETRGISVFTATRPKPAAPTFLRRQIQVAPIKIQNILTDNPVISAQHHGLKITVTLSPFPSFCGAICREAP